MEALQEVAGSIEGAGATLLAISPQLEKYSQQVVKKLSLTFPLLSDPGNSLAAQFGLVFTLPEDLRQVYLGFGIDLERFNNDASWTLTLPARFIVAGDRTIVQAEAHVDYTTRPEPLAILDLLPAVTS